MFLHLTENHLKQLENLTVIDQDLTNESYGNKFDEYLNLFNNFNDLQWVYNVIHHYIGK